MRNIAHTGKNDCLCCFCVIPRSSIVGLFLDFIYCQYLSREWTISHCLLLLVCKDITCAQWSVYVHSKTWVDDFQFPANDDHWDHEAKHFIWKKKLIISICIFVLYHTKTEYRKAKFQVVIISAFVERVSASPLQQTIKEQHITATGRHTHFFLHCFCAISKSGKAKINT